MPQHAGAFDCVTTCFFIDTAHNIIEYIEVIRHVLKARATRMPSLRQGNCHVLKTRQAPPPIVMIASLFAGQTNVSRSRLLWMFAP